MATGKLEQPTQKPKKYNFQNAFNLLKDKRYSLFRRGFKTVDESSEVGDPVYHLLRCAANPTHQPSTCKCVCHMDDYELNKEALEMASPIDRIFPPRHHQKTRGSHSNQKQLASLPSLNMDANYSSSPSSVSKKSFTPFRFRKRTGSESKLTLHRGSVDIHDLSMPQGRHNLSEYNSRSKTENPIFTFD